MWSTADEEASPPPGDLHRIVGQIVAGRLRVLGVHHAGPRGVVYEVEPPGVGDARRAMKVIDLPEAREPEPFERLVQFIDLQRAVQHPHLETVYELATLPNGTPYVVAEWLPLAGLDAYLPVGGRLGARRAREVIWAVAEALAALHAAGLTHGDVRTGHVLVQPAREGFMQVKLVGAGVVARLDAPLARGVQGGLAFLAPERIDGLRATPQSDVYALGALAYLLLTGVLPLQPEDPRADVAGPDPAARLRWLHLHARPARPARRVPAPADFPVAIEAVVGRALAKRPEDRHPDAEAFRRAFDAAWTDELEIVGEDSLAESFAPDSAEETPAPSGGAEVGGSAGAGVGAGVGVEAGGGAGAGRPSGSGERQGDSVVVAGEGRDAAAPVVKSRNTHVAELGDSLGPQDAEAFPTSAPLWRYVAAGVIAGAALAVLLR